LNRQSVTHHHQLNSEQISQYVAELQVHMALAARNLVPSFDLNTDSRSQLLQETQAHFEKLASRQELA
jgi:hypothetical protein